MNYYDDDPRVLEGRYKNRAVLSKRNCQLFEEMQLSKFWVNILMFNGIVLFWYGLTYF